MATLMGMKQVSIAEARNTLPALVHEAEETGPIQLLRRGRPVAVLVSLTEFDRLRSGRKDAWTAFCEFRASHDLTQLDVDEMFRDLRAPSQGPEPGGW